MKHKHYDVMVEWAADTTKVVQFKDADGHWKDCEQVNNWATWIEYRIKPEPKPDVVVVGIIEVGKTPNFIPDYQTQFRVSEHYEKDNIRLTFDGDTGKLKKAEVL